jgi:hypothetical protein
MKQGTKTLLYVLGGAAVVGGIGTAIYLATKKSDTSQKMSDAVQGGAQGGAKGGAAQGPVFTPGAATSPNFVSFWVQEHSQLIDQNTGNA